MDGGVACMQPDCGEVDLLPMTCPSCGKSYCSRHFPADAHQCSSYQHRDARTVECPLCKQAIAVRPGDSADVAVSAHIDRGCAPQRALNDADRRWNFCSFKNCTRNEIQPIICEDCKQTFCLEHRHPSSHQCRMSVRRSPAKVSTSPSQGPPSPPPAPTSYTSLVNLIPRNSPSTAFPLSGGSTGVDPTHQLVRVFGYVPVSSSSPECIQPAFFSVPPSASVGRVLDAICRRLDIPNSNNLAQTEEEKLMLHALQPLGVGTAADAICLPANTLVKDYIDSSTSRWIGRADLAAAVTVLLCKGQTIPKPVAEDLAQLKQYTAAKRLSRPAGAPPDAPNGLPAAAVECLVC